MIKITEQEVISNRPKKKIKIYDKKFNMFMEEMREKKFQNDDTMRVIHESFKKIDKYLSAMTFVFNAAIVVLLIIEFVALMILLK